LARLKINGIQPNDLKMDDINTSFFNGHLSKTAMEMMNDTDEDSEDLDKKMEELMSMPITHWIVISKTNKLYKFICGFELALRIISSYYYASMASFHNHEDEADILGPVLFFETFFGFTMLLNFFVEYNNDDSPLPIRNL
jgi:hypothetical protein